MYIADLHIHSRYSRATSKDCTPEHLDLWARKKGIHIVGTGDFTHPAWREELSEKLTPAEDGFYVLKDEYRIGGAIPGEIRPRFVVSGEISSIYKKNGRVRKVHSLILLPGLEDAQKISARLEQIGNIHSDGRPILGLDCRDLLEITLEISPGSVYVPAHIWTPHFSLFGAFSGFDTVEECFEDLTPHIHAMETGLSSDPPMNWRVSALDRYQLISNSDAHSPAKLGREANLLDIPMSYQGLSDAIQTGKGLYGTIEFFPEEGKYHMDGHRKCNLCLTPAETMKYGGKCPVCGRKITVGVSHRVEELSDRAEGYVRENAKPFESLVPLPEVIGACVGHSAASVKVQREYERMVQELGTEFEILRTIPADEIRKAASERIAEGIERLREGKVERIPGFDGEYGVIRLFSAEELHNTEGQMSFFDMIGVPETKVSVGKKAAREETDPGEGAGVKSERTAEAKFERIAEAEQEGNSEAKSERNAEAEHGRNVEAEHGRGDGADTERDAGMFSGLNPEQEYAVRCTSPHIAVKAGPGTGKTKTLISRLRYLLEYRKVRPGEITAVTFTNQAAAEMRERLIRETGKKTIGRSLQIGTFHAVCMNFLKELGEEFSLIDSGEQKAFAEEALEETGLSMKTGEFLESVSRRKSGMTKTGMKSEMTESGIKAGITEPGGGDDILWQQTVDRYEEKKRKAGLLDFDDLLLRTAERIRTGQVPDGWEKRFRYLLTDEFQDINPVQLELIRLWSGAGRELFVIGDPDQSIYGFRGADAACFDRLKMEYDDLELITLKENYRSSPQILRAAEAVISGGAESRLHPNCPDNVPVRIVRSESSGGEAVFIAKEIGRMTGGIGMLEAQEAAWESGERKIRSFDEIAVLCRTHHQAEIVERCLKKESIPYIMAGREDFLNAERVQNSLRFFRLLEISTSIREGNIGEGLARECASGLWNLEWSPMAAEAVRNAEEKYLPLYRKQKPERFIKQWAEDMGFTDDPDVKKLLQMTVFYRSMPEFLQTVGLGVESDLKRCQDKKYVSGAVKVMTIHGSKGLEFPAVFIYGADQGSIPLESESHPADTEEERRLFYVGMTRAKEELILTAAKEPSEFLEELPEGLAASENAARKKREENWHQMNLFDM